MLAGIREEFISWIKHKCFERKPRRLARNFLDVRWVAKWKFVKASSVDKGYALDATTTKREDGKVRVIRMRMTLRGFKDWDALMLETYSGTAKRLSQKLVASEAATRGWAMAAIDIRKAFLKGVSYDELAKETGEQILMKLADIFLNNKVDLCQLAFLEEGIKRNLLESCDYRTASDCVDVLQVLLR